MSDASKKLFRLDLWRGWWEGFLQAGFMSLGQIIILKCFADQTPSTSPYEAAIFGSGFAGMVVGLFYNRMTGKLGIRKSHLAAWPMFASGLALGLAGLQTNILPFTVLLCASFFFLPLKISFITSIYHETYVAERRGSNHGFALALAQVSTIIFYFVGGKLIDWDPGHYRWICAVLAGSSLIAGWLIIRMPSSIHEMDSRNPLRSFRWVFQDKTFGYVLAVWFLFGFANLWAAPIRVTYAHNVLNLSAFEISMVIGVIPEGTRLLFLPAWGYFFDRANFIVLRMLMNLFFVAGMGLFFFGKSVFELGVATFLLGIGFSGGRLAWSLWVTKMAPPDRSGDYMAVHSSLTGIRGSLAPWVGYYVLGQLSPKANYQTIGLISAGLIALSIVLLIPVIHQGKRGH